MKGTNLGWIKKGVSNNKGNVEIVIPQILVFTLIQHTLSSMHSLVIYSIYGHPLNTLWQLYYAPTIHDSIGYTTFNIFEPFYTHWLHQTYVGPQGSSLDQGHSLDQRKYLQQICLKGGHLLKK